MFDHLFPLLLINSKSLFVDDSKIFLDSMSVFLQHSEPQYDNHYILVKETNQLKTITKEIIKNISYNDQFFQKYFSLLMKNENHEKVYDFISKNQKNVIDSVYCDLIFDNSGYLYGEDILKNIKIHNCTINRFALTSSNDKIYARSLIKNGIAKDFVYKNSKITQLMSHLLFFSKFDFYQKIINFQTFKYMFSNFSKDRFFEIVNECINKKLHYAYLGSNYIMIDNQITKF